MSFAPLTDENPPAGPWPTMSWPPPPDVQLEGQTVRLTRCAAADLAELLQALDDPRVWAHIPTPPPGDLDTMRGLLTGLQDRGFFVWTVRLLAPVGECPVSSIVGWTSFLDVSAEDARLEIGMTEYAFPVWGSAVNPETKLLLLTHAFEELGAGRVQLKTDIRNERSQRAIAKLGARYEGVIRRQIRRADGTLRDSVLFSIIAEEWPAVRDGLRTRLYA